MPVLNYQAEKIFEEVLKCRIDFEADLSFHTVLGTHQFYQQGICIGDVMEAQIRKQIINAFKVFDREDEKVDIREIGTIIRSLGCHPNEEELRDIIAECFCVRTAIHAVRVLFLTLQPRITRVPRRNFNSFLYEGGANVRCQFKKMSNVIPEILPSTPEGPASLNNSTSSEDGATTGTARTYKFKAASEEKLLNAFLLLDTEKKGHLESEKLKEILIGDGEPFNQEEMDEMANAFVDSNGLFDYKKYVKIIVEETD
ncbi:Dynein regulatory complex protein 8 [Nymphon striatum]|nr:Dynein regulatory complex protein 8 [Nymphon striatum]